MVQVQQVQEVRYDTPRVTARRPMPSWRWGGIGGLVFAGSVIAQNLIRASSLPANDASAAKIIEFYADGRTATWILAALFPIGAAGLMAFVSGLVTRAAHGARMAGVAGTLGAAGIYAGFTATLATDLALSGYVHRGTPTPEIVSALWMLHNAVFGVLLVGIGITLASLSIAAVDAGVVHRVWARIGVAGAVALGVGAAATPTTIDGSPLMIIGLLGFLTWVAFVLTASVGLLKRSES